MIDLIHPKIAEIWVGQYHNFGGVYDWEYLDAPPDKGNPQNWARCFKEIQLHNMNESIDNNYGSCNIF